MTRPPLSVVVSNDRDRPDETPAAWRALCAELVATDEVVWVDRTGSGPPGTPSPERLQVVAVRAPSDAGRGRCNALGLAAAQHPLVAFTDTATAVLPGWAQAAATGLLEADVVGGPVFPAPGKRVRDWVGFFVDYAVHAVPPYLSAVEDVSGNNVAYRRDCLPADANELWKHRVDRDLRAAGSGPRLHHEMAVSSHRRYTWWDLTRGQARAGASYAAERAASWTGAQRLVAAAACLGLPLLAMLRTWRAVRSCDQLRRHWARALPLLLLARAAWAAGEAKGYLTGEGDARRVW